MENSRNDFVTFNGVETYQTEKNLDEIQSETSSVNRNKRSAEKYVQNIMNQMTAPSTDK